MRKKKKDDFYLWIIVLIPICIMISWLIVGWSFEKDNFINESLMAEKQ